MLFQKAKFASFLIENFVPYSVGTTKQAVKNTTGAAEKDMVSRRIACRGLIMNCANAIRLQVNAQATAAATPATATAGPAAAGSSSVYLKSFFEAHPTWKAFMPKLTVSVKVVYVYVLY